MFFANPKTCVWAGESAVTRLVGRPKLTKRKATGGIFMGFVRCSSAAEKTNKRTREQENYQRHGEKRNEREVKKT